MSKNEARRLFVLGCALVEAALLVPTPASAHCDGMDGPVVRAAEKALATGDARLALIWVQPEDEAAIRAAFEKTMAVRKLSAEARELSDLYFLETIVRVHRAGEGAPYTGLKPAGRDLGPAIPAADEAVARGSIEPLLSLIPAAAQPHVLHLFHDVVAKRGFEAHDVAAGRDYVKAYVTFVHAVEALRAGCAHGAGETSGPSERAPHVHAEAGGPEVEAADPHRGVHADPLRREPEACPHSVAAGHDAEAGPVATLAIPAPLKAEHDELHEELVRATREDGEVGEAARAVARVLHPHFVKEEEYALPPLGLLARVAQGEVTAEMRTAGQMTERLKADLPRMLEEHRGIVAALDTLADAARRGGKPEVARFAEKLGLHARMEEEVLYPAAILMGEYLKLKRSR